MCVKWEGERSQQMRQMGRIGRSNVTLCSLGDDIVLTLSSRHTHDLRNISNRQGRSPRSEVSSSDVTASQNHRILRCALWNYKCPLFLSWHSCVIAQLYFFFFFFDLQMTQVLFHKNRKRVLPKSHAGFPSLLLKLFFSHWVLEV